MNINEKRTVSDLAIEICAAPGVFEKLGIDYCCGGQKTLKEACAGAGVTLEEVVSQLERAAPSSRETREADDWQKRRLSDLATYIVNKHHAFVRQELPRLERLLYEVRSAHLARHPELRDFQALLRDLALELTHHMRKEEEILFPYIALLESAADRTAVLPRPCFGTVRNPVQMMTQEHDNAGQALRRIRATTGDYAVPADGCATYRALLESLRAFEQDLHTHIHLENNILFPRACQLEDSVLDARGEEKAPQTESD
ncbi:MAG TPA: iron-sulfur cluster repair di-iron protein [Acidobacteriota bacterium]|jgi:regulator of cell morphogenesis and NO signaling|nr:iron-sulfur cluster repair di-iron protein [Acidobacteriota bacterium]